MPVAPTPAAIAAPGGVGGLGAGGGATAGGAVATAELGAAAALAAVGTAWFVWVHAASFLHSVASPFHTFVTTRDEGQCDETSTRAECVRHERGQERV